MVGLLTILFILLEIPVIYCYSSVTCPVISSEVISRECNSRTEHLCLSDSECGGSRRSKCCPSSRNGGCSLMCVEPRALDGCPIPLDFAMIVDTSGSISRRNFRKLIKFIQDMLDGFDISEKGTHVAVVEYSTNASVPLRFNDFSGAFLNSANLKRAISNNINHSRGYTYIDKALKLANTDVFSAKGGMRPNVTKVALVMTDGKQTVDEEEVLSADILYNAVQPLKDKNVKVLSLGIGKNTNLFDLWTLASSGSDVFLAENFEQLKDLVTDLTQNKCPVHGNWSQWSEWETCSVTCGGGLQRRLRNCDNPPPAFGGDDCSGESEEIRPCNEIPCEVDGNWTDWKAWEKCPVTCGGGIQSRRRTCSNPPPANGGKDCEGSGVATRSCNELPCPGDGSWARWKAWSSCSATCAGGTQSRSRTCTNPPPIHGGKDCPGSSEQTQSCNNQPCPVDGNWTEWRAWGSCSLTCGGGSQDRTRSCTNPPPAFGGANCVGKRKESRVCNNIPCPVDGAWSRWKPWGTCTLQCGGGTQTRNRDCSDPRPAHGGRDCPGRSREVRPCNTQPCAVDGNWTAWRAWGRCSRTCGGGTQQRTRSCTNPPPAFGGAGCTGPRSETRSCNEEPQCPVPGGWAQWSRWDACSVTCGSGTQFRYRTCTNPPPSHGGAQCSGQSRQVYYCDRRPCPVDGKWSRWGRWTRCSATCNGGKKKRSRTCSRPYPSNGGKDCEGERVEVKKCDNELCAVHGNWGRWSSWSACSKTCGGYGRRTKVRQCNSPPPANGGTMCRGSSSSFVFCYAPLRCEVKCNLPLDVAVLMDSSGSISRRNFQVFKRFIKSIITGFEVSDDHTHIAIIEYSTKASVQLKFNDFTGRALNRNNVKGRVNRIPHRRGKTFIDRALRLANEEVFTEKAGMRDWVKKVAFVMTDGEQTKDPEATKSVNEILAEAVQPLKDKGVRVITLGIGKKVNKESLQTIATGDFVFYASSFNELRKMVKQLKKGTCPISAAGYRYPRYQ